MSDYRAWATANDSFPLTVDLPGGRSFNTQAQLAVLLCPRPTLNPTRLTVKLPPTDLEGAQSTLAELAREWQVDAAEITQWAAAASRVTSDEHAYSTRVFKAAPIDFLRLEFQVEHHVIERQYVLDVLFSWNVEANTSEPEPAPQSA